MLVIGLATLASVGFLAGAVTLGYAVFFVKYVEYPHEDVYVGLERSLYDHLEREGVRVY